MQEMLDTMQQEAPEIASKIEAKLLVKHIRDLAGSTLSPPPVTITSTTPFPSTTPSAPPPPPPTAATSLPAQAQSTKLVGICPDAGRNAMTASTQPRQPLQERRLQQRAERKVRSCLLEWSMNTACSCL